jgi:hypothetical protein
VINEIRVSRDWQSYDHPSFYSFCPRGRR